MTMAHPMAAVSSATAALRRVLFVIPGGAEGSSMVFARRQAATLARMGAAVDVFFLRSRTSPAMLARHTGPEEGSSRTTGASLRGLFGSAPEPRAPTSP